MMRKTRIQAIVVGATMAAITSIHGCDNSSNQKESRVESFRQSLVEEIFLECALSPDMTRAECNRCVAEQVKASGLDAPRIGQLTRMITQQACAAKPFCEPPEGLIDYGPDFLVCTCKDGTKFGICNTNLNPTCDELQTVALCEQFCGHCGGVEVGDCLFDNINCPDI
jgi:hypothetical protein